MRRGVAPEDSLRRVPPAHPPPTLFPVSERAARTPPHPQNQDAAALLEASAGPSPRVAAAALVSLGRLRVTGGDFRARLGADLATRARAALEARGDAWERVSRRPSGMTRASPLVDADPPATSSSGQAERDSALGALGLVSAVLETSALDEDAWGNSDRAETLLAALRCCIRLALAASGAVTLAPGPGVGAAMAPSRSPTRSSGLWARLSTVESVDRRGRAGDMGGSPRASRAGLISGGVGDDVAGHTTASVARAARATLVAGVAGLWDGAADDRRAASTSERIDGDRAGSSRPTALSLALAALVPLARGFASPLLGGLDGATSAGLRSLAREALRAALGGSGIGADGGWGEDLAATRGALSLTLAATAGGTLADPGWWAAALEARGAGPLDASARAAGRIAARLSTSNLICAVQGLADAFTDALTASSSADTGPGLGITRLAVLVHSVIGEPKVDSSLWMPVHCAFLSAASSGSPAAEGWAPLLAVAVRAHEAVAGAQRVACSTDSSAPPPLTPVDTLLAASELAWAAPGRAALGAPALAKAAGVIVETDPGMLSGRTWGRALAALALAAASGDDGASCSSNSTYQGTALPAAWQAWSLAAALAWGSLRALAAAVPLSWTSAGGSGAGPGGAAAPPICHALLASALERVAVSGGRSGNGSDEKGGVWDSTADVNDGGEDDDERSARVEARDRRSLAAIAALTDLGETCAARGGRRFEGPPEAKAESEAERCWALSVLLVTVGATARLGFLDNRPDIRDTAVRRIVSIRAARHPGAWMSPLPDPACRSFAAMPSSSSLQRGWAAPWLTACRLPRSREGGDTGDESSDLGQSALTLFAPHDATVWECVAAGAVFPLVSNIADRVSLEDASERAALDDDDNNNDRGEGPRLAAALALSASQWDTTLSVALGGLGPFLRDHAGNEWERNADDVGESLLVSAWEALAPRLGAVAGRALPSSRSNGGAGDGAGRGPAAAAAGCLLASLSGGPTSLRSGRAVGASAASLIALGGRAAGNDAGRARTRVPVGADARAGLAVVLVSSLGHPAGLPIPALEAVSSVLDALARCDAAGMRPVFPASGGGNSVVPVLPGPQRQLLDALVSLADAGAVDDIEGSSPDDPVPSPRTIGLAVALALCLAWAAEAEMASAPEGGRRLRPSPPTALPAAAARAAVALFYALTVAPGGSALAAEAAPGLAGALARVVLISGAGGARARSLVRRAASLPPPVAGSTFPEPPEQVAAVLQRLAVSLVPPRPPNRRERVDRILGREKERVKLVEGESEGPPEAAIALAALARGIAEGLR